ncbi:Endothiapepsin [Naviculisporaceae sp. PSN 640]
MVSLPLLIVATLGATEVLSLAVPSTPQQPGNGGGFSVKQVRNPHFTPYGPLQLAKAYLKYGAPLPKDLRAVVESYRLALWQELHGVDRRTAGNVSATPEDGDVEYLSPVEIGTPAQTLYLDFDTGSSDLWVFSTETQKDQVNGQKLYSPDKSSTAEKMQGASWQIQYGDGSTSSGDVYTDKVTIGGVTYKHQAVESAQLVSAEFSSDTQMSGLVGLGFTSINQVLPDQQKTFFDNILPNLDSPVFTADLKAGKPGSYNFGWIDHTACIGNISYVPANSSNGYWGMDALGYSITVPSTSSASYNRTITAIVDTGTTLLLLPHDVVKDYYGYISGSGYDSDQAAWTFPCDATPIPDFALSIGPDSQADSAYSSGASTGGPLMITIPGSYMNYGMVSDDGTTAMCYGGMQSDAAVGFSILGDIVLKAAFVVFENDASRPNPRLGWAAKNLG